MRSAFLDDAEPEAIGQAVRSVLERRGALISEHRHSRVRFHGLRPHRLSWTRGGYVGIYQHLGEREAEVRLQLRARWPWRILWIVALVNVLVTIAAFATNPPGTTWSVLAIFGSLALVTAGILYVGTLRSVRAEEKQLLDDLEAELEALPDVEVMTDEERELADLEAELEGEIVRRKLAADRPPKAKREKGKRFSLFPARGPKEPKGADVDVPETPESRRERLLARKAELEARIREREAAAPDGPDGPRP